MLTIITTSNKKRFFSFGLVRIESAIKNNHDRLLFLIPPLSGCRFSRSFFRLLFFANLLPQKSRGFRSLTTTAAAVVSFPDSRPPPGRKQSVVVRNHHHLLPPSSSNEKKGNTTEIGGSWRQIKMASSSSNNGDETQQQRRHVNYADDSGLTSDLNLSSWNPDGEEDDAAALSKFPKSDPDFEAAKLGRPCHIQSFPTGTMEFLPGGTPEDCCGAVEATVAALQRRMSAHPPKILVLHGSLSRDSKSRKLAVEAGRILSAYGSSVRLYDPTGLPIFSVDCDPENVPKAKELRELVLWCEAMVWISPEIHGNMSSCFKNQIDWIPLSTGAVRPTQGKTVAVMQVEAGSQTFNSVNNMRVLARWMRMVCVPNQSSIPRAYLEFNGETGEMNDSPLRDRVVDVMDELYKYTILLRDQQPYLLQRYSENKNKKEEKANK